MEIINSTQFDEVTSKGIVVVDFFANWCGPCKMLAPVLEEMADEYKQVKFVKVDVDQDVDLARMESNQFQMLFSLKMVKPLIN